MTENIDRIRKTLGEQAVKLIAVTKEAALSQIEEAYLSGVTEFGENRVQDALSKLENLPDWLITNSHWHFIGHLQTNKVKQAIGRFALIHSVDSLRLAREISKSAQEKGITQSILLQVKMAYDPTKSGFEPLELKNLFTTIVNLPNIECLGLMTITPFTYTLPERIDCFNGLKLLRDELVQTHGIPLPELSMGMSEDWREAVNCGATIVRIGREIFKH